MISNNMIEDIKFRNDIEDVISAYVNLQNAGSVLKGLCPFHSEKTPSFIVYKNTQSFYCFGCQAGGDVISFIMRAENLDYISAVEFLAKRCGMELPDLIRKEVHDDSISRSRLIDMNTEAARFYRDNLFDDETGSSARSYLINSRKFSSSVIKQFGLGYSPKGYELIKHLKSKGFSEKEMFQGGFLKENDGRTYCFFRDKVMIPIFDINNNVIAFGGRVLDNSKPKYLNTNDTAAFKKSKNLYLLNIAKKSQRDYFIICEGYMDAIALHSAGFDNAIGTLGTALTQEHARLLKKYKNKAVLSMDSDGAGKNALKKAISNLEEVGIEIKVLTIKDAKDPDEFIKKFGNASFENLLLGAKSKIDYIIQTVLEKYDISSSDDLIKAARELTLIVSDVSSKVERDIFISKISSSLSVNKDSLSADVEREIKKKKNKTYKSITDDLIRITAGTSDKINLDYSKSPASAKIEEDLIGILLSHPEYTDNTDDDIEELFISDFSKRVFGFIKNSYKNGSFSLAVLPMYFSLDEVSRIYDLMNRRLSVDNSLDKFSIYLSEFKKSALKIKNSSSLEDLINTKRNIKGE